MSFGSSGFSFGQQPQNNQAPSGGLFGQPSSGLTLGAKRSNSFGAASSQPPANSLFGTRNTNASSANPSTKDATTAQNGTTSSLLFGQPSSGGQNVIATQGQSSLGSTMFGQSNVGQNNPMQTNTGIFGPKSTGSGLFGQNTTQTTSDTLNASANPLTASVDQASFTLQGVKPSPTLYTSLSVPAVKRNRDAAIYDLPSRPLASKSRIASGRVLSGSQPSFDQSNAIHQELDTAKTNKVSSSDKKPSTFDGHGVFEKTDTLHWVNSYEDFLIEKPTILAIKHNDILSKGISRLVEELRYSNITMPVAKARSVGCSQEFKDAEESDKHQDHSDSDTSSHKATTIFVNDQALKEHYYVSPTLAELSEMTHSELQSVHGLTIGRENYGQISYQTAINLSDLPNLGDLLGKLVIFNPGTVCVYPDEDTKKTPGHELNMPCIVTIEDAWPRTPDQQKIKDMQDPRMRKHIERLRKINEMRGGQFVTLTTSGSWVFKVPHFSTWGLPISEMIVGSDIDSEEQSFEEDYPDECSVYSNANDQEQYHGRQNFSEMNNVHIDETLPPEDESMHDYSDSESSLSNGEKSFSQNDLSDDIPQFSNWRQKLSLRKNVLLSDIAVDTLKRPTQSLSLAEMLVPPSKTSKATEEQSDDESEELLLLEGDKSKLDFDNLREYFVKSTRSGSDMPLFRTNLKFSNLSSLSPKHRELWDLLSILYEDSANSDRISDWFDKQMDLLPPATFLQSDTLELIFDDISRHNLKKAFDNSLLLQKPHLSVLISMLGDKNQMQQLNASASRQLADWSFDELKNIPNPIKHAWETAAGIIPSLSPLKITWQQWLGMRFWYSSETTVDSAVKSLPDDLMAMSENSIELKFLQAFADPSSNSLLVEAIRKLDAVDSFFCLQALQNSYCTSFPLAYADELYQRLGNMLGNLQSPVSAVYTTLHITNIENATSAIEKILLKGAVNVELPSVFGIPDRLLDEARAFQVSKLGDHLAESEYLIRAGRYQDAHDVIISSVGPRAVLSDETSQLVELLSTLEEKSSDISSWERGGAVYLSYARAKLLGPEQGIVTSLCFDCRRCLTPNDISKRAIAKISEWVAVTFSDKKSLTIDEVVKMQFDPNQRMVQILQQSARLLM